MTAQLPLWLLLRRDMRMMLGGDDFRIQSKMGNDGFKRKSTALPDFKICCLL